MRRECICKKEYRKAVNCEQYFDDIPPSTPVDSEGIYRFSTRVMGEIESCPRCGNPSSHFCIPEYVKKRITPTLLAQGITEASSWKEYRCPHCMVVIMSFKGEPKTHYVGCMDITAAVKRCNICTCVCVGEDSLRNHIVERHGGGV